MGWGGHFFGHYPKRLNPGNVQASVAIYRRRREEEGYVMVSLHAAVDVISIYSMECAVNSYVLTI